MNEIIENKCKLKHEPAYYKTTFFKWRQRIGFGISDYACNLAYLLVNTYLLYYYTDCAGLGAGVVGVMFVFTKIFDGVTDYLVGIAIDRTNTKMGRNRPWMFWGAPVLAVGMILLFCVPISWSAGAKLAWAYVTYMIFSFGYTLVNIPMGTVVPTLSADSQERTKIVTARMIFASLGSLTTASLVIPLVRYFAGGSAASNEMLAVGYRNTNIILGLIVIVMMWLCVFNIEEINPPLIKKQKKGDSIYKDLIYIVRTKPFMLILALVLVMYGSYYCLANSIAYYFTYVIGDESKLSLANTLLTISPIAAQLMAPKLTEKFSKRNIMQVGAVITFMGYLVLFFTTNITVVYAAIVVAGFGMGFRFVMFYAMLPECVDYSEWKFGKSMAGTQGAINGFTGKVSSAVASASVSALLVWGNYDSNAVVQSASALTAIRIAFAGISVICCIVSIVIMCFYDLDKQYPQMKKDLDGKKAAITSAK